MGKPNGTLAEALAETLRQRFFSSLHLGVLEPGSRLPSVRELAAEMTVDRRAIVAAYRVLERDGLVELRQRSGVYFADGAPGLPGARRSPPGDWAVDVAVRALEMGIPAPRLADRFHDLLSTLRLRACCLECNGDQRASLCEELLDDYGFASDSLDVDEALAEPGRPELHRADLFVTTQFHAGEVQELARRVGRPWIAVTLRTDIYTEIARRLPTGPVYFVVSDPRFAVKLGRIFSAVEGASNFRAVVVGRDDVSALPLRAPVYVTRAARPRLAGHALLERVMPEERSFAPSSAKAILSLIIQRNLAALGVRERRPPIAADRGGR